jgi:hypothetical protein
MRVAVYLALALGCVTIVILTENAVLEVMGTLSACAFSAAALLVWLESEIAELRAILRGQR